MTFDEIVQTILDDLNLTSKTARKRVGARVNDRYHVLMSLPWQQISRRVTLNQTVAVGVSLVTFPVTKIYAVFDQVNRPQQALTEWAINEMENMTPISDPPDSYAIYRAGPRSVTIKVNSLPSSAYELQVDGEQLLTTLSGETLPGFNEDFHDILIAGAKWFELLKLEKSELANEQKAIWDQRISDLKFHIAKTSYLTYLQGKDQVELPAWINTILPQ